MILSPRPLHLTPADDAEMRTKLSPEQVAELDARYIGLDERGWHEYRGDEGTSKKAVANKPAKEEQSTGGAGTELTRLIRKLGFIVPCGKCKARAREMDENGIEWCKQNKPLILSWLREAASDRGLPFVEKVAGAILNRAINNAEKRK